MELKELGLSEYEEKAYTALVRLGKSSASAVSRESGVSYGKIYEVLASLERKGIVATIPEKTKMFAATDPENLLKIVDSREKELSKLRKSISEMKQVYETREKEVVQVAKGKRNFYKIIREMPISKKFDYSIKYTSEYNPEFVRSVRSMIRRGVDVKTLTRFDAETGNEVKKWTKINKNMKKVANDGVAFSINESEVVIALIKNNTILSIKDRAFVNIMKTLFLNTYENAEKVKDKGNI